MKNSIDADENFLCIQNDYHYYLIFKGQCKSVVIAPAQMIPLLFD